MVESTAYIFGELDENAVSRLGVNERDAAPSGPNAGFVVDQSVAACAACGERLIEVADAIADVMDPGTAPGEELRDWRVLPERLEQFHLGLAEVQVYDARSVNFVRTACLHAEHIAVEGEGGVDVGDGDPDVGNRGLHDHGT